MLLLRVQLIISIHAPTKGATQSEESEISSKKYFNPRSHEGSDSAAPERNHRRSYFNPRSHEGSDRVLGVVTTSLTISIHAPTKGATTFPGQRSHDKWYFNPRSHEGSDVKVRIQIHVVAISIHAPTKGATKKVRQESRRMGFQSTLPRRERLQSVISLCGGLGFQSTLPRRERRCWISKKSATN